MAGQPVERRRLSRLSVDGRCSLLADDGRSFSATILDIAPLGIAVEACESLEPDGRHMLALKLHRRGRPPRLNALGNVRFVVALGTACR